MAENFNTSGHDERQNLNVSSYALAHADPMNNALSPGINQTYDSAFKQNSFARYRKSDPTLQAFNKQSKIADGMPDLGNLECHNRKKYGVKKPANVWQHEQDDNRISGFQIRTSNFRTSMFDSENAGGIDNVWDQAS